MTSQPMQITMFVIMVVFGLLCVIFDWLWLSDEMTREKGLVFGPADDGILITLFIIVIIGICNIYNTVDLVIFTRFQFSQISSGQIHEFKNLTKLLS